jgi:hypothetical protein
MYTYHYKDPDFKHCVVDSSRLQTENVRDKFLYNMGLNMKMFPISSCMFWNLLYKQSEESKSSIWLMVIWSNDWNSKTKDFFILAIIHTYTAAAFPFPSFWQKIAVEICEVTNFFYPLCKLQVKNLNSITWQWNFLTMIQKTTHPGHVWSPLVIWYKKLKFLFSHSVHLSKRFCALIIQFR